MRLAEEARVWKALERSRAGQPPRVLRVGEVSLDLSAPCLVLGGRNGAGKSRVLRGLEETLGGSGFLIDLHHLSEQALILLRSRDDFGEMKDEYEALGPDESSRRDVQRIVGREYESIEWYALEVEPSDQEVARRFRWNGEQSLVPYFEVSHCGVQYSSRDMGLGEFSVHFLFWILEQLKNVEGLTLLLDEPDAFLPPVGASALLARLQKTCLKRGWNVVLTTHSTEMIAGSVERSAFILLRVNERGETVATHVRDDPSVSGALLGRPPVSRLLFVEDESASALTAVLLEALDRSLARSSVVLWANGSGDLDSLRRHLPHAPRTGLEFWFLYDGDKRDEVNPRDGDRWPALFLPTVHDPDELLRSVRIMPAALAERLKVPLGELQAALDAMEGMDRHDWVNGLGEQYGRARVLRCLAEVWVEENGDLVEEFSNSLPMK